MKPRNHSKKSLYHELLYCSTRTAQCIIFASITISAAHAQTIREWTGASSGAWLTTTNWNPSGTFPGSAPLNTLTGEGDATDIFTIAPANTSTNIGINMNNLAAAGGVGIILGGINIDKTNTATVQIGNSSTTVNGILQLNGAEIESVPSTLIRLAGNANLTIANVNSGTTAQTMGLRLGAANGIFEVASNRTLSILSNISEDGTTISSITKTGSGVMILAGNNSITGGSSVSAGTLIFRNKASIPSGTNVFSPGTTVGLGFGNTTSKFSQAEIVAAFSNTLAGVSAPDLDRIIIDTTGATAAILSADIATTAFGLEKSDGGANLTITGNNQYSGRTFIGSNAALIVNSLGNKGNASSNVGTNDIIEFKSGGRLDFSGNEPVVTSDKDFLIQGNATIFPSAGESNTLTLSGNLTSNTAGAKSLSLGGNGTGTGNINTFSGTISNGSGTVSLTKLSASRWILAGTNSYTGGTTVSGGTLEFRTTTPTTGNISVTGGGTIIFSGETTISTTPVLSVSTGIGTLHFQSDGAFAISNGLNYFGTSSSHVIDRITPGSGDGMNFIFNGSSSGGSNLNDASNGANITFRAGANITSGTPTITITNGFRNQSSSSTSNTVYNPIGVNLVIGGLTTSSRNRQYVLSGNSQGNIISGAIINGSNNTPVTKIGTSTWTLSSTGNNYTGATTITAGTLRMGTNNVFPNSSSISIGDGILDAATYSDSVGTLDVTALSSINLDSGAALAFADSSAVDWTGGTLTITGTFVSGSSLRFGTTSAGLTSQQLSQISAQGFTGFALNSEGYLTANSSVGGSPFDTWSGGLAFDTDTNGDGIANGIAWLLGAPNPSADAVGLLPQVSRIADNLVITFKTLNAANRGTAIMNLQHSSDLGISDPWFSIAVPDTSSTVNGVTFTVTMLPAPENSLNQVTATIPTSESVAGKLFGRLAGQALP